MRKNTEIVPVTKSSPAASVDQKTPIGAVAARSAGAAMRVKSARKREGKKGNKSIKKMDISELRRYRVLIDAPESYRPTDDGQLKQVAFLRGNKYYITLAESDVRSKK